MVGLKKVLDGVIRFRQTVRKDLVEQFERVRENPAPRAIFFTCMDSRILPARFTQSQVGDMFVVRNSGNIIPHSNNYGPAGYEVSVTTEPAALELAVKRGKINHVIVCGHSDCKAVNTLYNLSCCPRTFDPQSPMDHWLRRHGYASLKKLEERLAKKGAAPLTFISGNPLFSFEAVIDPEEQWGIEDKLSQINTLQQLENIASHGFLKDFLENGSVNLHAMWFDIYDGEMYLFSKEKGRFVIIDEESVEGLLKENEKNNREVGLVSNKDDESWFKVSLDGKILKTLAGKPLKTIVWMAERVLDRQVGTPKQVTQVTESHAFSANYIAFVLNIIQSEPLALAVAEEWSSQEEFIEMGHMRLTGLSFTAQDNPLQTTKESITSKILEYLHGDTVLFFNPDIERLLNTQKESWLPTIKHINKGLGTALAPLEDMFSEAVNTEDNERVKKWLLSYNHWALHGMQYAVETVKSVILPYNVVTFNLSAGDAVTRALLEQKVQAETWGDVEWAHGIEQEELTSRLSAASLFVYFNSHNYTSTKL